VSFTVHQATSTRDEQRATKHASTSEVNRCCHFAVAVDRWRRSYTRRVQTNISVYEAVGGMPFFEALVERFYDGVAQDPMLLRVYPHPEDLSEARTKLTLFLVEYWGGPPRYFETYGHPRLRMRHAPFEIGSGERDRWLTHMRAALGASDAPPAVADAMLQYFEMAAEALRNRD
jgi:hemoglobin